ncbi:MAG: hypothetical protein ACOX8W_02250 [bacterium]|jgi:hypothetical protein
MQNLVVVFDAGRHDAAAIARLETEIWNGLKLSGELNRTRREEKWILQYNSEKTLREDSIKKIKAFETALEVNLRELGAGSRGKRRTRDNDISDEDEAWDGNSAEADAD